MACACSLSCPSLGGYCRWWSGTRWAPRFTAKSASTGRSITCSVLIWSTHWLWLPINTVTRWVSSSRVISSAFGWSSTHTCCPLVWTALHHDWVLLIHLQDSEDQLAHVPAWHLLVFVCCSMCLHWVLNSYCAWTETVQARWRASRKSPIASTYIHLLAVDAVRGICRITKSFVWPVARALSPCIAFFLYV